MKTETVKGFKDYSGGEARKRAEIRKIIVGAFESYGFEPAETPVVEYADFVKGDNAGDEAVSDTFKLKDRGKRDLALRYEFTFQLKRLMNNRKLPYRRYQIGEVFRDEPISERRFRQFTQCDVDVVGSIVKDEAEILALCSEVLNNLGIKPVILVNNRVLLNEILDDMKVLEKNKLQVLREVDKYGKMPEVEIQKSLKKLGAGKLIDYLKKGEGYFKKFDSYSDLISLKKYCKIYGVDILISPTVVRGLSYYNGNVFEIKAKDFRESLIAGGSYMFNSVQCTGVAFGLDRISLLAKIDSCSGRILVVSLEQDKESIALAQKLRKKGKSVSIYYGKLSKALEYADSYEFDKIVFVGEREVKADKFKIKDMKSGKEDVLKI
ncbi:MAG: histidine--tRNA ligase [Nanoarchaeota archaeon]|nr:histidine--tRNA ligase [Nanoarchaeota archaeon]